MLSIFNYSANLIQNNVNRVTIDLEDSIKSVASGRRINSAKDDASGLAISLRLASELKSNIVSLRNAADTKSLLDTADGAIDEIQKNLLRIRELAVQGKNGTLSTADISALNAEASQRIEEIDRITNSTTWANTKLLDGSVSNKKFQIGSSLVDTLSVSITNVSSSNLGLAGYSVDMSSGSSSISSGSSSISGTSSHDTLQGDGLNNTITGGVGNDLIDGGESDYDIAVINANYADFDIYEGAFTTLNVMGSHTPGVELGFEIIDGNGTVYLVSYTPGSTGTSEVAQELANATFKDTNGNNVTGHGFVLSKGADASIHIRKNDGSNFSVRRWAHTDNNTRFGFEGRIFDGYSELTNKRDIESLSGGSPFTVLVGKQHGNQAFANTEQYGIDRLSQVEWIKFNDGYYQISTSTFISDFSVDMTSSSTTISGTTSSDNILGDSFVNTITGSVGADFIDGKGGDDVAVFSHTYDQFTIYQGAFTSLHVTGGHATGHDVGFEIVDSDGSVYRKSYTVANSQTHIVATEIANAPLRDSSGNVITDHKFIIEPGPNSFAPHMGASIRIRKSDSGNFSVRPWSGNHSGTKFGFEGRIADNYPELTGEKLIDGSPNGSLQTVVVGRYNGNMQHSSFLGYLADERYGINRLENIEWLKFTNGYYEVSSSTFSANPFTPTLAPGASGDGITTIDLALDTISSERGKLGALSNRLDHIFANGSNLNLNLQNSLGKIIDTDYAREIGALTKNQIIQNASLSLLAQANAQKYVLTTLLS